jgi:hypothetical protein
MTPDAENIESVTEQLIAARESYKHYSRLVLTLEKELEDLLK